MTLQEFYSKINGDYNDAIRRLMNERLMDRFVRKFPSDPSMQQLLDSAATGNWEEAFRAVHTLKGVSANLGFTELFRQASELTEHLRGGKPLQNPELLERVKQSYNLVMNTIDELTA